MGGYGGGHGGHGGYSYAGGGGFHDLGSKDTECTPKSCYCCCLGFLLLALIFVLWIILDKYHQSHNLGIWLGVMIPVGLLVIISSIYICYREECKGSSSEKKKLITPV